jgi:YhcH/YjgK/YiaL family protein
MILDKLQNHETYLNLNEKFVKAFDFIKNNDLKNMENGKYEIEGEEIFAMVQNYSTKELFEGRLESHHKYIDIQYMISGTEQMGYAPLQGQEVTEEILESDLVFYDGEASILKVEEGMFAIFYPNDLHMPGLLYNEKDEIKKLVIKVAVD